MVTLVLYIGSLPNLTRWFPCRRGRTLFLLGSLSQKSRSSVLLIEFLTTGSFPHDNFSSVYWIFTKLGHMIPLWKWKNPIYFGVITIVPFDNLYRRAYFVMHTFLVLLWAGFCNLKLFPFSWHPLCCWTNRSCSNWLNSMTRQNDGCKSTGKSNMSFSGFNQLKKNIFGMKILSGVRCRNQVLSCFNNRIGGIMVSVLAVSVVGHGFEPRSGQTMKLVFVASPLSTQY